MIPNAKASRLVVASLGGAVVGYGLLHPYAMAVFGLYGHPAGGPRHGGLVNLLREGAAAFDPAMFAMGLPFAGLGAAAGLFFAFWREAERQRHELEKRAVAVETLRQLMVTLAHHLLNAVQVVGGFADRSLKKVREEEVRRNLEIIRKEAERIEAIVHSLQALESIETERYASGTEALMIEIRREMESRREG